MVTEIPRLMWTLCLGGVNSVTDHQVGFCVFLEVIVSLITFNTMCIGIIHGN
jgi:hypothetical protein